MSRVFWHFDKGIKHVGNESKVLLLLSGLYIV